MSALLLDFVARNLVVSYRASEQPQIVTVDLQTTNPGTFAAVTVRYLAEQVRLGGAGGAEFSPLVGSGRVLRGGPDPSRPPSTSFHAELEVAGASPFFIRRMVENLRGAGAPGLVSSMSIVGSLPLDATALSVTEANVRRWIDDVDAYPGAFEPCPFEVERREVGKGASVRVHCAGDVPDAAEEAFQLQMVSFSNFLGTYLDHTGTKPGALSFLPNVKRGRGELSARWQLFDIIREPAAWLMQNLLLWFHHRHAAIRRVVLSLS